MCTPFKLNIGIIGKKGCGKSSLVEGIVRHLHGPSYISQMPQKKLNIEAIHERCDTDGNVPLLMNYGSPELLHKLHLQEERVNSVGNSSRKKYERNLESFFPLDVPHLN